MKICRLVALLLVACGALGIAPRPAQAGSNPFVGEIEIYGFNFCPVGWMPLNGALLSIANNAALYNLIGTTYGGDGSTNFALPTAKPIFTATGAPLTLCIALFGIFPSQN